jgi:hypothetical protein
MNDGLGPRPEHLWHILRVGPVHHNYSFGTSSARTYDPDANTGRVRGSWILGCSIVIS